VELGPRRGPELIDESIPVGLNIPHEAVALQCQLQTEQAVEKLLVPADPLCEILGADCGILHAGDVRVLHRPVAQLGEEGHGVGILRAQEDAAPEDVRVVGLQRFGAGQEHVVGLKLRLLPFVPVTDVHRDRA